MNGESTADVCDPVADGLKLLTVAGYLHSVHATLVEAIDASGDDIVAHKLVLARAAIAHAGKHVDQIGGRWSKRPRLGVFDDDDLLD